jgi:hypothetical protein
MIFSIITIMDRRLLILILLPSLLGLTHCARSLPPVGLAKAQSPLAGSPNSAWREVAGRCTLVTATLRISCRAVVRRDATGGVRLALLADEGVLLSDVAVKEGRVQVHREAEDLAGRSEILGHMAWQAWGKSLTDHPGIWQDGAWMIDDGVIQRWFAGDPLALRRVEGSGFIYEIGDYRPWGASLLAHQAHLSGIGFTVQLQLDDPVAEVPISEVNSQP